MNNADLQAQLKALKLSGMAEGLHLGLREAAHNDRQSEYFYAIGNERYSVKSMILTSNRTLVYGNGIFPDPLIANTILDRLVHNACQIIIKGESCRKHLRPAFLKGLTMNCFLIIYR